MQNIIFPTLLSGAIILISILILIYVLKKRRNNKNSIFYIIGCIIVLLFSLSIFYPLILDTFSLINNTFKTIDGVCEISTIKDINGRAGSYSLLYVEIDNMVLNGDNEQFLGLEDGVYACKVSYTEHSKSLIDIILN